MEFFQGAAQPELPVVSSAAIDVLPIETGGPVDVTTPGAAVPAVAPAAAPGVANPDRSIEAAPAGAPEQSGAPEQRGNEKPGAENLPDAGVGLGSSLGIGQLLAMVMAAVSAFASWRTRVA